MPNLYLGTSPTILPLLESVGFVLMDDAPECTTVVERRYTDNVMQRLTFSRQNFQRLL